MRVPDCHYLTLGYMARFGIELREFQNYQPKGFMRLKGRNIRMEGKHTY